MENNSQVTQEQPDIQVEKYINGHTVGGNHKQWCGYRGVVDCSFVLTASYGDRRLLLILRYPGHRWFFHADCGDGLRFSKKEFCRRVGNLGHRVPL